MGGRDDEIYMRLRKGRTLSDLGLPLVDGRSVVEGLEIPEPIIRGTMQLHGLQLQRISGDASIRGSCWRDLHFQGCDLSGISFHKCSFENCRFEESTCRDIRLWACQLGRCGFVDCDLRGAVLGSQPGRLSRPNTFLNVQFQEVDLRDTVHFCEQYQFCSFLDCVLESIEYIGSVFTDCVFEGFLKDVSFTSKCGSTPWLPENRLLRCNFRKTIMEYCEFRNINYDPSCILNDDMIILPSGRNDFKELQLKTGLEWNEGQRFLIEELIDRAGTPAIEFKSYLREVLTPGVYDELLEIIGR